MAEAIISRLLQKGIYLPSQIFLGEPNLSRQGFWQKQYQVKTTEDNQQVFCQCEILLLAIKPQIFNLVTSALNVDQPTVKPLILSILAGTSLSQLQEKFPSCSIIRVMPNTPALVGEAMSAIAPNQLVTEAHLNQALELFQAIGKVITIPESQMDAVTGLSGSGPAFVAIMIEALADGGVASGLPRAIALELAIQTVLGTAELIKQKNLHPAILKDQVTSPGGTTIAGVNALEKHGFRSAVMSAVIAAYQRSQELQK